MINDDVLIDIEKNKINNYEIVSKSNLISTIEGIENAAKVKDFNQDELVRAAKDISRINERKNRSGRK